MRQGAAAALFMPCCTSTTSLACRWSSQYERQYETLIKNVRSLEGELADYNLAMDKSRTSTVRHAEVAHNVTVAARVTVARVVCVCRSTCRAVRTPPTSPTTSRR
jgi:hypothetical protein